MTIESSLRSIVVVDNDRKLCESLCAYFTAHGFESTYLTTAESFLSQLKMTRPDIVLLGDGLPNISGLEACKRLRSNGDQIAIIMMSGRIDPIERIVGLETGADDYVSKPFVVRELLARARAVHRRRQIIPVEMSKNLQVRLGEWIYEPFSSNLHRGQEVRALARSEFLLLNVLTSNPDVPLRREQLLRACDSSNDLGGLRVVDSVVMRLRKLFEPNPTIPRYVKTVRGLGYVFRPHQEM